MIRTMPRESWRETLDSFSRQHEGWLVSVSSRDRQGRMRLHAADLPLQGVSPMTRDSTDLAVIVGDGDRHLTHQVRDVTTVIIELTDTHAERALVIDSADGTTTTVLFRSPMRPEDVDGLPFTHRE